MNALYPGQDDSSHRGPNVKGARALMLSWPHPPKSWSLQESRGGSAGHLLRWALSPDFRQTYPLRLNHANVRTDFSRSHCRVFAAAINPALSLVSTTPTSCPTFAVFKSARPPLSTATALR